jgi:hypothetical protein
MLFWTTHDRRIRPIASSVTVGVVKDEMMQPTWHYSDRGCMRYRARESLQSETTGTETALTTRFLTSWNFARAQCIGEPRLRRARPKRLLLVGMRRPAR